MNAKKTHTSPIFPARTSTLTCDLLPTEVPTASFSVRVKRLRLTPKLETKILSAENHKYPPRAVNGQSYCLETDDEKELASEALLLRHKFSTILTEDIFFRQATLSVIQNIYLFKHRRIFFSHSLPATDYERQDALFLFSAPLGKTRLKLAETLQHLIIARVWHRILATAAPQQFKTKPFQAILQVVEDLNTIRNSYMLLTRGLVYRLAANINTIYSTSLSFEDAVQVGSLGIARASYRYHQSCGIRFSTFASRWVMKEIQRQSLKGRLIKISAATVDKYALNAASQSTLLPEVSDEIARRTTVLLEDENLYGHELTWAGAANEPSAIVENLEQKEIILAAVDQALSGTDKDIIKRRYGFPPYQCRAQSIIAIAKTYGVTRSSIYQREQKALTALKKYISIKGVCHYA